MLLCCRFRSGSYAWRCPAGGAIAKMRANKKQGFYLIVFAGVVYGKSERNGHSHDRTNGFASL